MSRRVLLLALALLGVVAGTAMAAFVSSTSTGVNTFTTRAVTSTPTISGGVRITNDPSCGLETPEDTVRQSGTFYACVGSVSDVAGIASVTADLSPINGDSAVPLLTTGGPFSGYDYRSGPLTAGSPLDTGTSGAWSVRATNNNGDRSTLAGNNFNIRSYYGMMVGEFGAPGAANVAQYYRLSDVGATARNAVAGSATLTYNGTPTRDVPGALVGNADTAVRLNGSVSGDYLSGTRRNAIASNYSVELWVKGSPTSGAGPGTVWSDSAGLLDAGDPASAKDFGVALDATGRVVAGCGNGATVRSAAGAVADGNWHHVVFTRERTSGQIELFVDGASVDSAATCNTVAHNGSPTIWLGRSHESDLYATVDLDEPALYSRIITAGEVLSNYELARGLG